jgi:S-layer homology domain
MRRASWVWLFLVAAFVLTPSTTGVAKAADRWTDLTDAQWGTVYQVSAEDVATVAQGYPNGDGTFSFRPSLAVTRAQFTKMSVDGFALAKLDPPVSTFADVARGDFYYQWIEGGAAAGLISGYPNGDGTFSFRPGTQISRQQSNSILGRYLSGVEIEATGHIHGVVRNYLTLEQWYSLEGEFYLGFFTDQAQVATAHRATTAYLVNQGVVVGSTQGGQTYLYPQSNLTRAQAAALIIRTRTMAMEIIGDDPTAPTDVVAIPASPANNAHPIVTGRTTTPNGTVTIYDATITGTVKMAEGQALADGSFSLAVPGLWAAPLMEGSHLFTARVTDSRQRVSVPSAPVDYLLDVTAPAGSIVSPPEGGAFNMGEPLFQVTASDAGSGMESVTFFYKHEADPTFTQIGQPVTGQTTTFTANWGDLNLPNDRYDLEAVARDRAGNLRILGPLTVIIDTTPVPTTITLTQDPTPNPLDADHTVTAVVKDQFGANIDAAVMFTWTPSDGSGLPDHTTAATRQSLGVYAGSWGGPGMASTYAITAAAGALTSNSVTTSWEARRVAHVVLTPGNAVLQLGQDYTLTATLTDQFSAAIDATVTFVWTKTDGDASVTADRTTTLPTSGGQVSDSQTLTKWAAVEITVSVAGYGGTIPPVQVYWAPNTTNLQYRRSP